MKKIKQEDLEIKSLVSSDQVSDKYQGRGFVPPPLHLITYKLLQICKLIDNAESLGQNGLQTLRIKYHLM